MLKQIDAGQGNWGEKFKQILADFPEPENKAVSLEDMGAAKGWEDWSLWEWASRSVSGKKKPDASCEAYKNTFTERRRAYWGLIHMQFL